jgi:hypothetical protein
MKIVALWFGLKRGFIRLIILVGLLFLSGILWTVWLGSDIATLPDHDYLPDILALRAKGRIGEAAALARSVEALPNMPHAEEISRQAAELDKEYNSWTRRAKEVFWGAASGNAETPEALAGAIITDFLFIGDIRDLGIQGWKKIIGEDADEFLMVLSGVGLVASAATFVPVTTPEGLTAEPIITTMKCLKKVGSLTDKFVVVLKKTFSKVVRTKELKHAQALLGDMGGLMKKAPAGTLSAIIKRVDAAEDLAAVSKWCAKAPDKTVAALHVAGPDAVKWMKSAAESTDRQLGLVLRKGAQGFAKSRFWIRGFKAFERGRLGDLTAALQEIVMNYPGLRWVFLLLALGCTLAALLLSFDMAMEIRSLFGHPKTT